MEVARVYYAAVWYDPRVLTVWNAFINRLSNAASSPSFIHDGFLRAGSVDTGGEVAGDLEHRHLPDHDLLARACARARAATGGRVGQAGNMAARHLHIPAREPAARRLQHAHVVDV